MEEGSSRAAAAPVLLDEIIVEILARLPAKSLCRCKCVSPAWRALISDPANRRRFAQTLGFFFPRRDDNRLDFIGLSMSSVAPPPPGVDAALSFLPPTCGDMELLDTCNGLLLLRCKGVHESPSPPPFYVVCNPATAEWVTLPPTKLHAWSCWRFYQCRSDHGHQHSSTRLRSIHLPTFPCVSASAAVGLILYLCPGCGDILVPNWQMGSQ